MHKLTAAQAALLERCAMTLEQIKAAGPRRFAGRTVDTCTTLGLTERLPVGGVKLTAAGREWLAANTKTEAPAPQHVNVDGPEGSGIRWHLVDADGNPITAGEHRAMWSGQPRFTIAERPEVQSWDGEKPLNIWIKWVDDTRGYCLADQLVNAWRWELEVTEV